ncbi:hypothetical protein F4778DRAFT_198514 [Xylariomycetidae sp. FL2044]|nr:hypothetical protein F4778DRAFT_198514 [Xylariomycetidae sp. FL2044]
MRWLNVLYEDTSDPSYMDVQQIGIDYSPCVLCTIHSLPQIGRSYHEATRMLLTIPPQPRCSLADSNQTYLGVCHMDYSGDATASSKSTQEKYDTQPHKQGLVPAELLPWFVIWPGSHCNNLLGGSDWSRSRGCLRIFNFGIRKPTFPIPRNHTRCPSSPTPSFHHAATGYSTGLLGYISCSVLPACIPPRVPEYFYTTVRITGRSGLHLSPDSQPDRPTGSLTAPRQTTKSGNM